jgi:hypothetical protein
MTLRDQTYSDLVNTIINLDEFATLQEFVIADGRGGYCRFDAPCIWDEDAAKEKQTRSGGVFEGDAVILISQEYFPRRPLAGELIYSPRTLQWRITEVVSEEGAYKITVLANRSH